jgi:hypothetical protein
MYSTLEPCSFHGRTPACSRVITERRIGCAVFGMRDPNPGADGKGARILRDASVQVVEAICEREVQRQLGPWVLATTRTSHDTARATSPRRCRHPSSRRRSPRCTRSIWSARTGVVRSLHVHE